MRTVLVTGGIASGKSEVCRYLASLGYPVYDCDSRTKALYDSIPGLKGEIEQALGIPFSELGRIFSDDSLRFRLESIVYPHVLKDIDSWKAQQTGPVAFVESAIALEKPAFDSVYDSVLMVTADLSLRESRNPKAAERASIQNPDASRADYLIENNSTIKELHSKVDKYLTRTMKTDLARILTVSGTHGLYEFVAQARGGAIAERLSDKKRTVFNGTSRISALSDIAIYTSEGEMRLDEVFTALHQTLGEAEAPSSKAPAQEIEKLFATAIPNYDADRFYLSHMKKVVDWYNEIAKFASLEFMTEEEREAEYKAAQEKAEE